MVKQIISVSHCFVTVDVERSVNKMTVDKLDNEGLISSMGTIFWLITAFQQAITYIQPPAQ